MILEVMVVKVVFIEKYKRLFKIVSGGTGESSRLFSSDVSMKMGNRGSV